MTLPEDVAEADEALVVDGAPAILQHYPAIGFRVYGIASTSRISVYPGRRPAPDRTSE